MESKTQVVLLSSLSVGQCALTLNQAIGREDWFDYNGTPAPTPDNIVGKVEGTAFRVQKASIHWRSASFFRPAFWGQLVSEADGTRIEGRFRLGPDGQILRGAFLALVAIMFVLLSVPALAGVIRGAKLSNDGVWALVFPPIGVLWGVLLPRWALWWNSEDRAVILNFLRKTLSASVQAPPRAT